MNTIEIIDINDTKKNISRMEIIKQDQDSYVEVNVVGKTGREWVEFYPLEIFMEKNPEMAKGLIFMMETNKNE